MKAIAITKVTSVSLELSKKEATMLYLLVAGTSGSKAHELTKNIIESSYKNFIKENPEFANLSGADWYDDVVLPLYDTIGEALNLKTD